MLNQLPQELKLSDYDWREGRNVKQFMKTTVIEPKDQLRTLASGLASIYAETDGNTKIVIIAPILITGLGNIYEEAWGGSVDVDDRQPTHILFETNGEIIDVKQVSSGTDELSALLQKVYNDRDAKDRLCKDFDYVKEKSVVDVDDADTMITLPIRFFPTIYANARKVINVCKPTDELIRNGGNFVKRGEYTHFLIMLTSKNRWMVCIRTSDIEKEPGVSGVINEVVRTFDYEQDDMIINLLLETGVDAFDPVLDIITESIAGKILEIEN